MRLAHTHLIQAHRVVYSLAAPPSDVAAVGLLGAAVVKGHDAAVQALLMANPPAAFPQVWASRWAGEPHRSASPLQLAATCGNSTAARALLAAASGMATQQDEQAQLPFFLAAGHGHSAVAQLLLDAAPQAATVATHAGPCRCSWLFVMVMA